MAQFLEGILMKCVGGFYYVEAADAVYECHARGIFRKQNITPLAGDKAKITLLPNGKGWLEEIGERRNSLVRPPVANLDNLVIVASITEPEPNTLVIDKMIAIAECSHIEPIIVISKSDLNDTTWMDDIYRNAGFDVYVVSSKSGEGVEDIKKRLNGKLSAFTGNSGVGKSSLLNAIDPHFQLQTGEISKKLGRGRHTTRTAELFKLKNGGYIVDTPGFSSIELERMQPMLKEDLPYYFREFIPYLGKCKFTSCSHTKEEGCAILKAVENGEIMRQRHDSYREMYDEIKDIKAWDTINEKTGNAVGKSKSRK